MPTLCSNGRRDNYSHLGTPISLEIALDAEVLAEVELSLYTTTVERAALEPGHVGLYCR